MTQCEFGLAAHFWCQQHFGCDQLWKWCRMVEEHPNLVEDVNSFVFGACRLFLCCFWTRMMFWAKCICHKNFWTANAILRLFGACRLFGREPHRSLWTLFACLSTTGCAWNRNCFWRFLDAAFYFWRSLWRRNVFGVEMVWIQTTLNSLNCFMGEWHHYACLHTAAAFFNRRDSKYRRGTIVHEACARQITACFRLLCFLCGKGLECPQWSRWIWVFVFVWLTSLDANTPTQLRKYAYDATRGSGCN